MGYACKLSDGGNLKLPLFRINIATGGSVSQTYGYQNEDGSITGFGGIANTTYTFPDGHMSIRLHGSGTSYTKRVTIYTSGYYYIDNSWSYYTGSASYYSWSYGTFIAYYNTLENPFE